MQHHDYITIQATANRIAQQRGLPKFTREDFLERMRLAEVGMEESAYVMMQMHWIFNEQWIAENRPYYLLYPSIIPMLTRLRLDAVPSQSLKLPHGLKSMLIRFPMGTNREVRSIWMTETTMNPHADTDKDCVLRGLLLGIDHGERATDDQPVFLIRAFPLSEQTIEESLDALPASWTAAVGKQLDSQEIIDAVRVACTVCLMDGDPDLISPEVLSKDERKVSQDNVDQLVDKAKRRGKFGWSLGKDVETMPHYRRPHPALVWTGPGRKIPKIIMRSGSVVHREVVEKVPTGYGTPPRPL